MPDIAADEPGSGSFVIGADVSSTNHERPAGVAECFQRSEDGVSAPSSEISAVFKSEPTSCRFSSFAAKVVDFADDADGFEEEAGALAFDAFAFGVGAGDVLAGRAPDDDIGEIAKVSNKSACRKRADVVIDRDTRIVLGVEGSAPGYCLAGGDGAIAGAMEAERPAASGSAEKVQDARLTHGALLPGRCGGR